MKKEFLLALFTVALIACCRKEPRRHDYNFSGTFTTAFLLEKTLSSSLFILCSRTEIHFRDTF